MLGSNSKFENLFLGILYFYFPWVLKGFKVDQWIGTSSNSISYYPKVALLDFANPKAPLSGIFSRIWVMRARMTKGCLARFHQP